METLPGQTPCMSYANWKPNHRTASRGTVTDQTPKPPSGLSPAQGYRWTTAHQHLAAANATDINNLDAAGRTRHFARLRATIDDLLRLTRELSSQQRPSDGESDVL